MADPAISTAKRELFDAVGDPWMSALVAFCLPDASATLARLGKVVARPQRTAWVSGRAGRPPSSAVAVPTDIAGYSVLVLLERMLALSTVSLVLGQAEPVAEGPLTRIEIGILHGVLALSAGRLVPALRRHPEIERPPTADQSIELELAVTVGGFSGPAWVRASWRFFHDLLAEVYRAQPSAQGQLHIEIGRTEVSSSALASAETGDTVVFDEVAPAPVVGDWAVTLRRNGQSLPAVLRPDGSLGPASQAPAHASQDERTGSLSDGRSTPGPPPASPFHTVAASLRPIGLGEIPMAAFLRGMPFGPVRTEVVTLLVDDVRWAEGRLVELDGALAVRITRKLPG
jgi:hypothetical protein